MRESGLTASSLTCGVSVGASTGSGAVRWGAGEVGGAGVRLQLTCYLPLLFCYIAVGTRAIGASTCAWSAWAARLRRRLAHRFAFLCMRVLASMCTSGSRLAWAF